MTVPSVRVVIRLVCLVIVHFKVANSSQYLVKCNRENTKCLRDISSKGFVAKETNVPGFYSAEDPTSPNTTDETQNNVPDFSIAEDPSAPLNVTDYILENRIPVQETRGYEYSDRSKFSKIASKGGAKLKSIEGVELVEEQIYEKRVKKTRDTYWNDMWAVNGEVVPSMKVIEAWNLGYSGRGIYVAVVDDGVDISHMDLFANTRSSYHYDYRIDVSDPSPIRGDMHGTNCAGLVGAERDNNKCIAGIAYKASIVGIRLLGYGTTDMMEGQSLSHALSHIDIYSNSWGPEDGYGFVSLRTHTSAAIEHGIQNGRNGKGSIYVWAAGNGGLSDNCNADGFVKSIYTIAISSINSLKESATYAEVCTPVMAVTYGGGGGSNAYLVRFDKYNITVHPVLGFGLMDAEAMVKTAISWRSVPDQKIYTTVTSYPNSFIQTWNVLSGVTSQISIQSYETSIRYLEHVIVSVYFKSNSIGDTELQLLSPDGTMSYLLTSRPLEVGHAASVDWNYMTVHHWGESPVGTWTLRMLVSSGFYSGMLNSWQITFYGTSQDPGNDNPSETRNYTKSNGEVPIRSTKSSGTSVHSTNPYDRVTTHSTKSNGRVTTHSTKSNGRVTTHSTKLNGLAHLHSNTNGYSTRNILGIIVCSVCGGIALTAKIVF
ncbi:hypothetical protein ACJMK2_039261 [Sinanodonta woodiana]|uniref:P/Homo B domain-containing protein n=1 Tax=Sinanodonta woodiana TaxID=1069815 RepID=A0ABD3WBH9_SINWO